TNGVLHLLAIAREGGVPLELAELAEIGERTPVVASLAPSGRHVAEELHRAGGTRALLRELVAAGLVDGDAPTARSSTPPRRRSRRPARSTRSTATLRRRAHS